VAPTKGQGDDGVFNCYSRLPMLLLPLGKRIYILQCDVNNGNCGECFCYEEEAKKQMKQP
jgi:hypothetical protein